MCHYHPCFTDEGIEAQRGEEVSGVTQWGVELGAELCKSAPFMPCTLRSADFCHGDALPPLEPYY